MNISFWSGVSNNVVYSAMQSWYCFDGSWSRASMPPGGIAGVCAVIFFVTAATNKKVKTKYSKQENIYSPLRHQSMKARRYLSQNVSVTAMSRMTNLAMVQKRDLKEEFTGNFAKPPKKLNNPTLNSATLRIWEEFQKEEKKGLERLACWKSLLLLVQNCQNLRRIPLLRVPTWLVCGLYPVHHLRTRALSFLAAVIYYRISKTSPILISLKSNKFSSPSFLQRKGDTVCWFALGNIRKKFLFFYLPCM